MDIRAKIETEIKRLEEEVEQYPAYIKILELRKDICELEEHLSHSAVYITIKSLKNILSETTGYKILDVDRSSHKGSRHARVENKLADTSHYKEMLDFIEAYLENETAPRIIAELYDVVKGAGYELGGKNPTYNLSVYLSKDPRFTPTNKGWILTSKVKTREQAKERGRKTYYTGQPCSNGHITERYTSSADCVTCKHLKYIAMKEANGNSQSNISR